MYIINQQSTTNHKLKLFSLFLLSAQVFFALNLFYCNKGTGTGDPKITSLSVIEVNTYARLTWTDPTDTTFKEIEISSSALATPIKVAKGIEELEISGLAKNGSDTFTLTALDESGESISTIEATETPVENLFAVTHGSTDTVTIPTNSPVVLYPVLPTTLTFTVTNPSTLTAGDYTLTISRDSTNTQDINIAYTTPEGATFSNIQFHRLTDSGSCPRTVDNSSPSFIDLIPLSGSDVADYWTRTDGSTTSGDLLLHTYRTEVSNSDTVIRNANIWANHIVNGNSTCVLLSVENMYGNVTRAVPASGTDIIIGTEYHSPLGTPATTFNIIEDIPLEITRRVEIGLAGGETFNYDTRKIYIFTVENTNTSERQSYGIEVMPAP